MSIALHVEDSGNGTPVVWIHGFPLSSLIFEQQRTIPGVRHIAPDLPGFGRSENRPIDSIDEYGDVIISLLQSLNVERAILAGVSMGGYVVFSIVRRRPALAAGLVLIDTRECSDSVEGRMNRQAQLERVEREGTSGVIADMIPKMLTEDTILENDDRLDIVRRSMEAASVPGVTSALRAMAERPDSSDVLRDFERPILVVVGSHDTITPPDDARRMAALAKRATVVEIAGAAHLSNVERANEVNEAIADFISELT